VTSLLCGALQLCSSFLSPSPPPPPPQSCPSFKSRESFFFACMACSNSIKKDQETKDEM